MLRWEIIQDNFTSTNIITSTACIRLYLYVRKIDRNNVRRQMPNEWMWVILQAERWKIDLAKGIDGNQGMGGREEIKCERKGEWKSAMMMGWRRVQWLKNWSEYQLRYKGVKWMEWFECVEKFHVVWCSSFLPHEHLVSEVMNSRIMRSASHIHISHCRVVLVNMTTVEFVIGSEKSREANFGIFSVINFIDYFTISLIQWQ